VTTDSDTFDPYDGCEVLRRVVEGALAPYGWLPREDWEELRDFLIVHVTTHPAMRPLYAQLTVDARLKKRKPKAKSGVVTARTEDTLSRLIGDAARAAKGGRK
jgi:hypothetical protein